MSVGAPVPARVEARVKQGLLEAVDYATGQGWSVSKTCEVLGLDVRRARRWRRRWRANTEAGGQVGVSGVSRTGEDFRLPLIR
ncbi:helix-turn-helix domain-containing protein [Actinomyces bowdenii]|uniref:helix-turn-helix domain-containing protein n=1 Tax=Actinomyces bowdenii TaxID=131109 RepID=UPI001FB93D20|nr:helix-turn-helix domain-containing protein [Actinomyces bowdenii]